MTEMSNEEKPVSRQVLELLLSLRDRQVFIAGTLGASVVSAVSFAPWIPFFIDDQGKTQVWTMIVRIICMLLIPVFAAADKIADGEAKKKSVAEQAVSKTAAQDTYQKSISSLLSLASRGADIAFATPGNRKTPLVDLRSVLATATHGLSGASQTRATYYTLEFTEEGRILKDPVSWGRVEEATTIWLEADAPDHSVWAIMDGEDVNAPIARATDRDKIGWANWDEKKYKSFISVPVKAQGAQFGMLSLNAIGSEDLTETDRMAVLVAARLMATTLSLGYGPNELKTRTQSLIETKKKFAGTDGPPKISNDHETGTTGINDRLSNTTDDPAPAGP